MQLLYMIITALLAGLFAAGVVWIFWENGVVLLKKLCARREARMLQTDAAALMDQAKDNQDVAPE